MISDNESFVYYNLAAPQQYIRPQAQSPEQNDLMPPKSQCIQFTGTLSPPRFHPSGESFNATPVAEMTVHQTANWIRTFGRYHRWNQVEAYVQSFVNNGISGVLLEDLTPEMLEFSLGILDPRHQHELLTAIEYLYPNRRMRNTPVFQESITGIQILESSYSNANRGHCHSETDYESGYESTNSYLISSRLNNATEMEYSDMMSESAYSQRTSLTSYIESDCDIKIGASSTDKSIISHNSREKNDTVMVDRETHEDSKSVTSLKGCRPLRCRKLLLVLGQHEIGKDYCSLQSIRSRFQQLEIQVEVVRDENKPNTFTLVFPNYQHADEVLSRANEIGYRITKKYPPRPNPKRPLKYMSMAELEIRTGKSLNGDIVGKLKKGVIVTVNQVKGRRARLIRELKNGGVKTIGWVSLHEQDGINLLQQLGDF